jgi:membrane protease YdiL (CAAX protease family)
MQKLHELHPIWHAVSWVVLYVLLVNVGDALSAQLGQPGAATAPLLVALSAILVLYVRRNGWLHHYGLRRPRRHDFDKTLLYIPLVIIAVLQYAKGLRDDLDLTAVVLIIVLMVSVGFIEERVFRGFLFRAILRRSTLIRAAVISGVTFGIGHVVNLARGYTGAEQAIQVGFAVVLGMVLALLFAITGTIVPLIAFHALFNITGSLTLTDTGSELGLLAITLAISVGYASYLAAMLRRHGPASEVSDAALPASLLRVPGRAGA